MASVSIDSGEFKLMRNVDIQHQPSRSAVYTEWIRAFSNNVPNAVHHLADVIEDVYTFELWKDNRLDTPEQFFERMGIFGLNLDEPARLIKELRKKRSSKRDEIVARAEKVRELREQGMTQQAIADELGVSRRTVNSDMCAEKSVMTQKPAQPRKAVYQISEYTKPETAAQKIRDKFGEEFAFALGTLLVSPQ